MLCITEIKYMTLIVSKIFLAKHLLFFLLCKRRLLFPNEGHQAHIPQKNVTPDLIGGGCFYNKFSTDLMFLKLLASKQRAFSLLHHMLPRLWGLFQSQKDITGITTSASRASDRAPNTPPNAVPIPKNTSSTLKICAQGLSSYNLKLQEEHCPHHRIPKWFGLERTSKFILFQSSAMCPKRCQIPVDFQRWLHRPDHRCHRLRQLLIPKIFPCNLFSRWNLRGNPNPYFQKVLKSSRLQPKRRSTFQVSKI